jgi:signal transduction histidine kinase
VDGTTAYVDRERLMRCVLNIVNNAQDAMPNGGRITIAGRRVGSSVEIDIADTGPGIPPAIRSTLFEPFVTYGKSKGTGLGLAITRRVVEQHGGTIGFACGESGGTTFTITIPIGSAQRAA